MLTGHNYIAGSTSNSGTDTFQSKKAETNELLPTHFHEATKAELDKAVTQATEAFKTYSRLSGAKVSAFLNSIADEIVNLGAELITLTSLESGLPEARITGERGRTVGQLRLFAKVVEEGSWVNARIDLSQPDRQPLPKPDVRSMRVALGPVAVFGASNFPLAFSTAGGDTASALAAGCPVIVKAHPSHPGSAELVAQAIEKAIEKNGLSKGVFSLLHGFKTIGEQLVTHPGIKAVGFTGSLDAGRALCDLAAKRPEPVPVYAEMGSVNPVAILPEKMSEQTDQLAALMSQSISMGVGQFCTNPGLIFVVDNEDSQKFIAYLGQLLSEIPEGTMLNEGIASTYQYELKSRADLPSVTTYGVRKAMEDTQGAPALLTVSADDFIRQPTLHEELFGPASLIVTCESIEKIQEAIEKLGGQLTGTFQATEKELLTHIGLVETLKSKVGRLLVGGAPTGVEVCHAMVHGGPYPASSNGMYTSVGTSAIDRFVRAICFQNVPDSLLPDALKNVNPLGIMRLVEGEWSTKGI